MSDAVTVNCERCGREGTSVGGRVPEGWTGTISAAAQGPANG
jgi:hypothetical protein